jgi:hypothetical protein
VIYKENMMLLKDVPKDTKFIHVDFQENPPRVLTHYGLVHEGFDMYGESLYTYNAWHVGNIVNREVVLFETEKRTMVNISSRAGEFYNCELVGGE